jgi:hypothetical protein
MKEITELADELKSLLNIKYNAKGVKFLEGFIERNKTQIEKEEWNGLINSCGAFLGQSIIENYGGKWIKEESEQICIAFDEKNKVFPFSKVSKQFENGLEDSIYSMFSILPTVYKIEKKVKKKWWQF